MVDDRTTTTVSECDFGVLVSKSEFEPFRRRENGPNANLDAGCVPETSRKGDATSHWQTKTRADIVECSCCVPEKGGKGDATATVVAETAKTVAEWETT